MTNQGNEIIWVVVCTALVFLMQGGFTCLETGLTRSKNNINVAMKNLMDFVIAVLVFWALGFAMMFGESASGLVGTSGFLFDTGEAPGATAYFLFQAMFCATAATIISGASAVRSAWTSSGRRPWRVEEEVLRQSGAESSRCPSSTTSST